MIRDEDFIRGNAPMTKEDVRVLTAYQMDIKENHQVLDIGGGTGATAVSFAKWNPEAYVTVIEQNQNSIDLIMQNIEKFNLKNIKVIHGTAVQDLPDQKFDRVFIGGGSQQIEDIFLWLETHLAVDAIVVGNTIAIESTHRLSQTFIVHDYEDVELTQIQISKGKRINDYTLLNAQNPITIISGRRN